MDTTTPNTTAAAAQSAPLARSPVVRVEKGVVHTTSRDVAAYFEKRHPDVMRSIDDLISHRAELRDAMFVEVSEPHPLIPGRMDRVFDMDKDGFMLLTMGFTGKKALALKLDYIRAFNEMEEAIYNAPSAPTAVDFSDPSVVAGVLRHFQIESDKKDKVIEHQGERLKTLDRIEASEGSMCLMDAAKTLKVQPKQFFALLSAHRWTYKRAGNSSWIGYQDKIQSGHLEHRDMPYHDRFGQERVRTQCLVTAKGLVKLAALIEKPLH